jgi:CHAD domain-containing protein
MLDERPRSAPDEASVAAPQSTDAALLPTQWIDHLERHVPVARAGRDPEGVHQIRVAIARLRAWLQLGGYSVLHDDLRWLRGHAARVRDIDVHLARDPPPAVRRRLLEESVSARQELLAALDDRRFEGLLAGLEALPPLDRDRAGRRLAAMARTALRRGRRAFAYGHNLRALHELRCAIRRLRFGLDFLGECPRALIALQDALGLVGDGLIALGHVDQAPRGDGVSAYRDAIEEEIREHRRAARRRWILVRDLLKELAR